MLAIEVPYCSQVRISTENKKSNQHGGTPLLVRLRSQ